MHLPPIITDLAIILLVAGVTTILFKKINQPLVLGYIIAGIITGPNFQYFPTIVDTANIATWSEIGVIFLLFALGLEFSFYKLKSVGSTAFIGTTCEILGMLFMGYFAGRLLGWSNMDSVFLGGMLSMSSTTIIIKAFDDLNMRQQSFTEIVFGMLIVEDIAGIVMMVLLSTIAVTSTGISPAELTMSVLRLVFFLTLWFVCGMYIVPTFFKKAKNLINEETLIIICAGLCLGMVVLATHMGFSSALGAFIMGSLIAEAPDLHIIEKVIKPVKDLFGAIFFVSVGMLVDPVLLMQYWIPIVTIIVVTIIGKLIFSTSGVFLGGQSLNNSIHAGFSLAQIGEFSFIIAGLGTSLGVTSDFLYPIVVAVSVTTTFTTPYFINSAEMGIKIIRKILPEKFINYLDRNNENNNIKHNGSDWQNYLTNFITRMLICGTLLTAIILFASFYMVDFIATFVKTPYHRYATAIITIILMSPILRTLMLSAEKGTLFSILWLKHKANHIPLICLVTMKLAIAAVAIILTLTQVAQLEYLIAIPITIIMIYFISKSNWLMSQYLNIESRFLINLNAKHIAEHRKAYGISTNTYFGNELKLGHFTVTDNSNLLGQTLASSQFRLMYGCNILQAIDTNDEVTYLPRYNYHFTPQSKLLLIGTTEQMRILKAAIENNIIGLTHEKDPVTLTEFFKNAEKVPEKYRIYPYSIIVENSSPLLGKTLRNVNFRNTFNAVAVGIVRGDYTITNPSPDLIFQDGDLVWL
ncbi:MAG: cation:proton antiporter, partial [Phascolarctobacterium sp.]|nr:cation:proton antiporter [Candidatus Phascolarctobacterium caballi]